jgi:hypothetical protein
MEAHKNDGFVVLCFSVVIVAVKEKVTKPDLHF